MTNIIDINDFRKPPSFSKTWVGDVSLFLDEEGQASCVIKENNDDLADSIPDRLRLVAETMFQCAWLAMKMAHKDQPNDRGDLLFVGWTYENGLVKVQVDGDKFTTEEQLVWLDEALDDAKGAARRVCAGDIS